MKILVSGAKGFIAGYLIEELLKEGHQVVGIDNLSKYGEICKSYDNDPNFHFIKGDAKDLDLMKDLISDCDHFIGLAAMIGGITYFHKFAYDLLAENERITATAFDAAIWAHQNKKLKKITVISSSMVYESCQKFPTAEGEQVVSPPPQSTYGFQKLATEYFAKGAFEQYQLPYTIIRPFNCVGIGEKKALSDGEAIKSGNLDLALSHVVPDLIKKVLAGQDPLHILGSGKQIRHYTYGGDLAKGIILTLENTKALNNDFNLSTSRSTTVLELSEIIWRKINGDRKFSYVSDKAMEYDVQKRIPDSSKAKEILGFEATTKLEDMLDEIIDWIKKLDP